MKKILVYFENGMKAYFKPDELVLLTDKDVHGTDIIPDVVENNANAVNWSNVCFIRVVDIKEDRHDDNE